jgi:hypothetical protein
MVHVPAHVDSPINAAPHIALPRARARTQIRNSNCHAGPRSGPSVRLTGACVAGRINSPVLLCRDRDRDAGLLQALFCEPVCAGLTQRSTGQMAGHNAREKQLSTCLRDRGAHSRKMAIEDGLPGARF